MSEVVNLRAARKAKRRAQDKARADANALKHGRTKAQVAREEADARRAREALDAAKRET